MSEEISVVMRLSKQHILVLGMFNVAAIAVRRLSTGQNVYPMCQLCCKNKHSKSLPGQKIFTKSDLHTL